MVQDSQDSMSEYKSFLSSKDDGKQVLDLNGSEAECPDSPRTVYSNMRNARSQATFNLMMRMAPNALQAIRQEFYAREDSVSLTEFVHIMSKHLFNNQHDEASSSKVKNQDLRSFGSDMFELFKEVDVNGDGLMEWDEFTKFTVEKASSLNQSMVMTTIPEYFDNTSVLDNSAKVFRRGNITSMVPILNTGLFAVLEEHRKVISLYHSSNGRLYNEIQTESVPLAVEPMKGHNLMAASFVDLSVCTYQIDDNHTIPQKRNLIKTTLPTPDIQMSMAWMPSSDLLYTGASSGNIMSWNMSQNQHISTMSGHSDIVMKLLALDSLDSLMSASLDMSIGVWDTYTNTVIHKLKGHRKGVFSMSYNPDFRLLVSSGFDHDALVWSPFVNSLVYKLKGHHAALVGCQCVENSPELITADEAGVFKLWDVRTFQCIQTFCNNSNSENEPAEHLSCFFSSKIPSPTQNQVNRNPELDDSVLFAGSRRIRCFEQARVVHAKTTDLTNVVWADVNEASLTVITVSERNIIIWDLLLGSKIIVHNDMCKEEISACCLDDRKRKIIIGDINGVITVYNPLNGSFMKSCVHDAQSSMVISLAYINTSRRFLAGYVNGVMRLYDESNLDDCQILRNFDPFNFHSELTSVLFLEADRTVITSGTVGEPLKLWEYDSGKCDMELQACQSTETIIAVITLDPFPLLATSDSAGNIVVWGSRGCKWRGDKVTGFKNQHPLAAEMEAPLTSNGPRRIVPDKGPSTPTITPTAAATASSTAEDALRRSASSAAENSPTTKEKPSIQSMSSSLDLAVAAERAEVELAACAEKWGPLSAATALAWDPKRSYLYTADEQGTLRSFSLERIITELDGELMLHGAKSNDKEKATYRRSNSTAAASTDMSACEEVGGDVIPYIFGKKRFTATSTAAYRWGIQAHRETAIYCKATPYGILTSSTDNRVKMWDISGGEVGSLLSCASTGQRSVNWDLKLDIDSIMQRESEQLDDMLQEVRAYSLEAADMTSDLDDASQGCNSSIPDDKKTKFSRTSLRKRIEMSSRLLGLDFTNDQPPDDDCSESENTTATGLTGLSLADDGSLASVGSKSTKNALDEVRNIHTQTGLVTKKDRALSVLQIRHKECSMNKMVKDFEGRGISFPVLNNPSNPKKKKYELVTEQSGGHSEGVSPGKIKTQGSLQEIVHEEKVARKCKKFSTFDSLEKSLGSEHLPPLTKDERDKIRATRKEQRQLREAKEIREKKKKPLVRQKSKGTEVETAASGDDDENRGGSE